MSEPSKKTLFGYYLHRKLLYRGSNDMRDYLLSGQVNRFIYRNLLLLQDRMMYPSFTNIFNDIYYLCIRIQNDPKAGEDVLQRYFNEEEEWLNSKEVSMAVICIVWALIKSKQNPSNGDIHFLEAITPLIKSSIYMPVAEKLIWYLNDEGLTAPNVFRVYPTPLDEITIDEEYEAASWCTVTDNFTAELIEYYLTLYTTIDEQLELYNRITKACTGEEWKSKSTYFRQLKKSIEQGEYLPDCSRYKEIRQDGTFLDKGNRFYAAENDAQLRRERDEAVRQLEDLKSNHQLELIQMDVKHQIEIDKLKRQLEQQPKAKTKKAVAVEGSSTQELALRLTELVNYIQDYFSKEGAVEASTMLYKKAIEHGNISEAAAKLIGGIVPAVQIRDTKHQIFSFNKKVNQVNINSEVENKHEEK